MKMENSDLSQSKRLKGIQDSYGTISLALAALNVNLETIFSTNSIQYGEMNIANSDSFASLKIRNTSSQRY